MMKKIKKYIKKPDLFFVFLMNKGVFSFLPDKIYLKWKYKIYFGKKLDLDNPSTFNEKLQWLKLNDRNPFYTELVDKYEVRKYVADTIGKEYLIPLIGVYEKFKDINFEELPSQFVIKCTHDSGSVFVCKDKNTFDYKKCEKQINKALKRKYFGIHREWPYKNVKPRIIIEKYMNEFTDDINDYKFFVFNGKIKFYIICSDRSNSVKYTFFDAENNFMKISQCGCKYDENVTKPVNFIKMENLAKELAKDIPQLRVDFYEVNNKVYFGELTFYDSAGFGKFEPEEWDLKIGQMLTLPKKNK